ncbi:MAG: dolichol kinase [Halodesulfurarchaeum sp.]
MSEPGRRLVHASGSLVPGAYLAGLLTWEAVRWLLLAGLVLAAVLEALRLRDRLDWWIYRRLTREYEDEAVAGYALAVFGAAVTGWLFPPGVAVPALLMLTLADPASGLLSRDELGIKRSYVLLAMFGLCLAIASLLLVPFWPAVAGAAAATAADGVKPTVGEWVIDDNLTIPTVAAAAMHVGLLVV